MNFWNGAASLSVILLSAIALFEFCIYIYLKIRNGRIVLSVFNFSVLVNIFLIIILPFMYEDRAWRALGNKSAATFFTYLNKNAEINLSGMIIFLLVLTFTEFRPSKAHSKIVNSISLNIDKELIDKSFYTFVIAWLVIVFVYNGTLPLLNGHRDFYKDSRFANIAYIFLTTVIPIYTVYYGICFFNRRNIKELFRLVAGGTVCLFTGNRSDLLIAVIYPLMLIAVYKKGKSFFRNTLKVLKWLCIILILGLLMALMRQGSGFSIVKAFEEFIYGNSFCDLRDGAYILYGWDRKFDVFLYGKTYLAGLLAFIPSFLLEYKRIWSWGYFSAITLFGMEGHYGLRGGTYCEAYLNFGYLGIILVAIFLGRWQAYKENAFHQFISKGVDEFEIKYLAIYIADKLFTSFAGASNGLRTFYILFALFVVGSIIKRRGNTYVPGRNYAFSQNKVK